MVNALVEDAFSRLFPGIEFSFTAAVNYSGRFKPYNATVRRIGSRLYFSLSSSWKEVSREIVIGLVQHLLVRILRKERFFAAAADMVMKNNGRKLTSLNMQLYEDFIKGISEVAAVDHTGHDEKLDASFQRVNERYFLSFVDKPNLRWGADSFRKLASYDYHTNTVTVSSLFSGAPEHLLDYLVYHELLHKKLKFSSGNGSRAVHHGGEFRKLEKNFEGSSTIEDELNSFLRQSRRSRPCPASSFGWRRLFMIR